MSRIVTRLFLPCLLFVFVVVPVSSSENSKSLSRYINICSLSTNVCKAVLNNYYDSQLANNISYTLTGSISFPQASAEDWTWGIKLQHYGTDADILNANTMNLVHSEVNHMYFYNNLYESYNFDGAGLMQTIVLYDEALQNNEHLQFDFEIAGDLTPEITDNGIDFKNASDEIIVRIEYLDIVLSDGNTLNMKLGWVDDLTQQKIYRLTVSKQAANSISVAVPMMPFVVYIILAVVIMSIVGVRQNSLIAKSVGMRGD